jgi:hypothetical protein
LEFYIALYIIVDYFRAVKQNQKILAEETK